MKSVNAPKALAIFLSVLTLFLMVRVFMTDLEKRELNHRYEQMIEQRNEINKEFSQVLSQTKDIINQFQDRLN